MHSVGTNGKPGVVAVERRAKIASLPIEWRNIKEGGGGRRKEEKLVYTGILSSPNLRKAASIAYIFGWLTSSRFPINSPFCLREFCWKGRCEVRIYFFLPRQRLTDVPKTLLLTFAWAGASLRFPASLAVRCAEAKAQPLEQEQTLLVRPPWRPGRNASC